MGPIDEGAAAKTEGPDLDPESAWKLIRESARGGTLPQVAEFGATLAKEALERVKGIEAKATSFAVYGIGIITLLASSAGTWVKIGNAFTPWIAFSAGLCAVACVVASVRALVLKPYTAISQRDWLKQRYLSNADELTQFWTFNVWRVLKEQTDLQAQKAVDLQRAQVWLAASVLYLLFFLLQIAVVFGGRLWLGGVRQPSDDWLWSHGGHLIEVARFGPRWGSLLVCGLGLGAAARYGWLHAFIGHRLVSVRNRIRTLVVPPKEEL